MIDLKEIEMEIEKLESQDINYDVCSKLADLYSIKDHFKPKYSQYSFGQSEFLQVCQNAPYEAILSIINEHMDCINALYPKEYSAIIKKIREASK